MIIHIQSKAKADLKAIWHYSCKNWGMDKADSYMQELNKGIETLLDNPQIGFSCDYIRNGYRQYTIKKHMIFYKIQSDKIVIIRILHESMDYKINLN
jgi:toxin ParE1/3/4